METQADNLRKQMDDSPWAKCSAIVAGTVVAGLFTTATVYLGIFTYNNPDPAKCWVVRDLDAPAPTKLAVIELANSLEVDVTEGYPIEMHKMYLAWFLWGFYSKCAFVVFSLISAGVFMCAEKAGKIMGAVSCALYAINGLVWVVCGGIWRFSKAGMIASGDRLERPEDISDEDWEKQVQSARLRFGYQVDSGRFLKIYLILAAWLIALVVIGIIVVAIVVACCDPRDKNYKELNENEEGEANAGANAEAEQNEGHGKRNNSKKPQYHEARKSGSSKQRDHGSRSRQ